MNIVVQIHFSPQQPVSNSTGLSRRSGAFGGIVDESSPRRAAAASNVGPKGIAEDVTFTNPASRRISS